MPPDPQLQNLAGTVFKMVGENGLIVNAANANISATREDVFDASAGCNIGFYMYNFQAEGSVKGKYISGAQNSVAAVTPGAVLALGNPTSLNGITQGGVFATTISHDHGEKGLQETTTNWNRQPGIPAPTS